MNSREEFEKHYADGQVRIGICSTARLFEQTEGQYVSSMTAAAWWGWQAARATSSLCPGHGRAECVSCCWPSTEQSAGYTAVDMGTAAASGYRDGFAAGRNSVVVDLEPDERSDEAAHYIHEDFVKDRIIAAGGKVK